MENSIMIAKVMGPLFIVVALGIAINIKFYQKMMVDFANSGALIYFAGLISLALGLFMAQVHDFSAGGWYLLVSIICVMTILKGAMLIVYPQFFVKIVDRYKEKTVYFSMNIIFILILGLVLTVKGYWG